MKQTTKRITSVLATLVFLIAAFVFYFDFVSPAYSNMQTLKGKELGEQNLLSQESQIIKQVQKLVATYQSEASERATLALSLPSGQNISDALIQIYGIAQMNNINIQNVSVSTASVLQNAGGGAAMANASTSPFVKPLGTISFAATANGSYEDFKNFLSELETNIRIFDVKSLSVLPAAQGTTSTRDFFNYNLTIVAYYQT